ncbi:MAG: TlpA family protein disulfide reductase, partial [Rhodanobacter sp.]
MSVGPLLFSTAVLSLLFGIIAGLGANAFLKRRGYADAGNAAFLALAIALLVARAAFVAGWWSQYIQQPMSVLNVRDSGFDPLAGVLALLLGCALIAWRRRLLLRPLAATLGVGVLAWALAWLATGALASSTRQPLPALVLTDIHGQHVA